MPSISGINHVQITVPKDSEDKARAFYCDLLGLAEIEKPENLKKNGGFWLAVGATQLHIGLENHDGRSNTKAHVALEVDDEKSLRKMFNEHGVDVIENTAIKGYSRFDIRDPFGNRIEFLERI